MNNELAKEYRAVRAEQAAENLTRYGADTGGGGYWPRQAAEALRVARWRLDAARRDAAFPLDVPRHAGAFDDEPAETALPFGDVLQVRIVYDETGADLLEDYAITHHSRGLESHFHAPDGWVSRDGSTIYGTDQRGRPYSATIGECSGYDFAQYLQDGRERNMPRHAAYLRARVSMQRDADFLRRAMNNDLEPCGYIVELVDVDGDTIAEESCWGYETAEHAIDEARGIARQMIERRMRDLDRIAASRREAAHGARLAFATLAAEWRNVRNANAPTLCALLQDRMQDTRNAARDAITTARAARAAFSSYAAAGFIADRNFSGA